MNAKGILKISDAASLAIHTMVLLATHPDETFSIPEIAAILKASQAHLAKVAQRLAKAGLVSAREGSSWRATPPKSACLRCTRQ